MEAESKRSSIMAVVRENTILSCLNSDVMVDDGKEVVVLEVNRGLYREVHSELKARGIDTYMEPDGSIYGLLR